MPGIAGWTANSINMRDQQDALRLMAEAMTSQEACRTEHWVCRQAALVSRVAMRKPRCARPVQMSTSEGEVVVVFSGELYNSRELEKALGNQSVSAHIDDPDIVLHSYMKWGEKNASYLDGTFAFALWDGRANKLLLSRDRFGLESLFYYPLRDGVLFASEVKGVLANQLVDRVVDSDGLRKFFSPFRGFGNTIWKGIHEVVPGTVVIVERGNIRSSTFWELRTRPHEGDLETTVQTVRELIFDSVNTRFADDASKGILLSGGLDSSSITVAASACVADRKERLRTYSVDFVGSEQNFRQYGLQVSRDAPYVSEMSTYAGTEHTDIVLDHTDIADPGVRRKVIAARDSLTTLGQMDLSLYVLLEKIKDEVDVVVTGSGSDAIFAGTPIFHSESSRDVLTEPGAFRSQIDKINNGSWLKSDVLEHLSLGNFVGDQLRTILNSVEHLSDDSDLERKIREVCYVEITQFMQDFIDRETFAARDLGLKVRMPYLDHESFEYVYNIPWRLKAFDGREKSLLRGAMKGDLPTSVSERVKSGYPANSDPSYSKEMLRQAKEVLAQSESRVFDVVSRDWLRDSIYSNHSEVRRIEKILDLYHWCDMYRPRFVLD